MKALRLSCHMTVGGLIDLPRFRDVAPEKRYQLLREAGYEGVQHFRPEPAAFAAGLAMTGMGRVLKLPEARAIARQHKAWGFAATTLHVGTGLESDLEMDRLADAVIDASAAESYPLHVETHRATITQDIRRTLDLVTRFPELTFNADLAHWYVGHEMTYGDIWQKIDALAPVLQRVRFIHGRIAGSGMAQSPLPLAEASGATTHFREMWRRAFMAFLPSEAPMFFAPELLPYEAILEGRKVVFGYAPVREVEGVWVETTDRWGDALSLCDMARDLFAQAHK